MAQNYGLGRGLSSLIPSKKGGTDHFSSSEKKITEPKEDFNYFGSSDKDFKKTDRRENEENSRILEIEISKIVPNPHQPRIKFDQEKLQELASSVKEHGIIQPIAVSKVNNHFELIAGERRFQAAKLAGLEKIPAILREVTNQQKLELAIIENIQRHDLNPIEEGKSYQKLTEEFGLTQEEISQKLGKSRSLVANKIRLLSLPVEIQRAVSENRITEGHAKAILAVSNQEKQRVLFDLILKEGLTVRQTESKVKDVSVKTHKRNLQVDPEIKRIEEELSGALGTKVKLSRSGGGGKIIVEFYSQEELQGILGKISKA